MLHIDLPLNSSISGKIIQVPAQSVISVPLGHIGMQMSFRPIFPNNLFQYCIEPIDWTIIKKPSEVTESHITCKSNQSNIFR